jgi:hypothetical protein
LNSGLGKGPRTLRTAFGVDDLLRAARRTAGRNPNVYVVVMGHSHEIDRTEVTLIENVGPEDKWYVNTGCWQKSLAVRNLETKALSWSQLDLNNATQFAVRFSYVVVDMDQGKPKKPERRLWEEP